MLTQNGSAGHKEERRLLMRYHRAGDVKAREALLHRFLPLARRLAHRYHCTGEPVDDRAGGCTRAAQGHRSIRRLTRDDTHVVRGPTILGELKRHFRNYGWAVHVPRGLQEDALRVDSAANELVGKLGRSPTVAEIAEWVGITPERVIEARQAANACCAVSLDVQVDEEDGDSPVRMLGVDEPGFGLVEESATIEQVMRVLDERQREVIRLRFEEGLFRREIGDRIGVSQMQVSRVIRQSITAMQQAVDTEGTLRA